MIKPFVDYDCNQFVDERIPWNKFVTLPNFQDVDVLFCYVAGFKEPGEHGWKWTYWQFDFMSDRWREGTKRTWSKRF